ncbi:PREDICTED: non-histone chromosomal protein 6-like [Rhagoletis zephyria]|uniref:non-histone chromosomal protein 6-like n=1 Tax=Rhagoletis zephyria TaxID=28612 RepID=UPI0008119D48|nr:PREDICTED: non-histone chromosomal protein 6-like [Rhagoletis zephyria]KAH9405409.1 DNA binding [Tyrophagus putrescentiae]
MARPKKVVEERKATTGKTAKDAGKKVMKKKPAAGGVKRPLNAYLLFSMDERAKAPSVKLTVQEIGQRWKQIDPAIKANYEAQAKEARENFAAGNPSKPAEKKVAQKKVEEAIPNGDDLSSEESMDEEESDDN